MFIHFPDFLHRKPLRAANAMAQSSGSAKGGRRGEIADVMYSMTYMTL